MTELGEAVLASADERLRQDRIKIVALLSATLFGGMALGAGLLLAGVAIIRFCFGGGA